MMPSDALQSRIARLFESGPRPSWRASIREGWEAAKMMVGGFSFVGLVLAAFGTGELPARYWLYLTLLAAAFSVVWMPIFNRYFFPWSRWQIYRVAPDWLLEEWDVKETFGELREEKRSA